jgi:hypothetical protein
VGVSIAAGSARVPAVPGNGFLVLSPARAFPGSAADVGLVRGVALAGRREAGPLIMAVPGKTDLTLAVVRILVGFGGGSLRSDMALYKLA